jgi:outer membrane cobalamin receptor
MAQRWFIYMVLMCVVLWASVAPAAEPNSPDESESTTLPEVTVTAPGGYGFTTLPERDLIERPFTESPGLVTATSTVGRKEIEQMHAYSVIDALNYIPGAWTETRGRKVKKFFSVRGQRYPYPGYCIDGAWFREFHEIDYYLSAANFDRIDVVRSSSAMMLGPGGITGMVNLIPRSYTENETQIDTLYGTLNTLRSNVTHGEAGENYNYGISAGYYHTDGSSDMNARENMTNLYGRIEYQLTDDVTLSWFNFGLIGDRQLKLAQPPASTTLQTRRDSFDPMYTYVTVAKIRHDPGDGSSTEVLGNYGGRRFDGHRSGSSDWLEEDYEYGTSFIHSQELTEENTLRYGALYDRWVSPTGKRFYVGRPGDIRTYSGVVVDEHDFGRLDASIGYRWTQEHIQRFGGFNVEGSASGLRSVEVYDKWGDPLHGVNLGASYELTEDKTLYGNAAWGQLSPQPGMLDANLQTPGNEDRYKFDLGLRKLLDGFGQASVTGFYVRQNDAALITSSTVTVNGEPFALFENADRKNYGVEVDVQTNRFKNGLQFFGNVTAMKTKRTYSGDWKTDDEIPDVVVGGGASYAIKKVEFLVFAKHLSSYENERFTATGVPAPLGDFVDLGAQVTYRHDKDTEFFVRGENITDDEYSTVPGYPVDGALFYAGFVKRFH